MPALLLLFIMVVDIGQMWYARVELENSLEAAALAAVKEWGDANGGDTLVPRQVGLEYAAANTINGIPVAIDTNYNPANPPNQNNTCQGNLVFGAVLEEDGDPCVRYIFNAGLQPSCGAGEVLIDASGQGSLRTANLNEWGIAFHRNENTPDNLCIKSVTLDLYTPAGNEGYFDIGTFGLSPNNPTNWKVRCPGGTPSQPDIFGFPSPATQIQWSWDGLAYAGTKAKVLKFNFYQDAGDPGFQPCDRIRFGVKVSKDDTSNEYDGDDVGFPPKNANDYVLVHVTVEFSLDASGYLPPAGPQPPTVSTAEATMQNDFSRQRECFCAPDPYDEFCLQSLKVHPLQIPDLPCPPASAGNNNGQSYALTSGAGLRNFGVRAQATHQIDTLLCRLCGSLFGPYYVSACTTAMYDCEDKRPRLIRVEQEDFICPGP